MKTNVTKTMVTIVGMAVLAFAACKDKDKNSTPPASTTGGSTTGQGNPGEVITHVELTLSSVTGTSTSSYTYKYIDPDGDGGQPASFGGVNQSDSVITLMANKTYSATIMLFDRSKTPIDTISNEVQEEGDEHMFFFNQSNPVAVSNVWSVTLTPSSTKITYADSDGATTPRPIGLESVWQTFNANPTKYPVKISLRHQPGAKDGTFAPGDTDVEAPFKFKVQ
jgi:hypothetical protein